MPPLYQVHDNLDHDNKPYAPGDEVELTKDAAAALALLQRGCDAGDPDGCASAADRVRAAGSSLEDQRRALLLDNRACQGGVSRSCVTIGRAYDGGFKLFAVQRLDGGKQNECSEWQPLPCDDYDDGK